MLGNVGRILDRPRAACKLRPCQQRDVALSEVGALLAQTTITRELTARRPSQGERFVSPLFPLECAELPEPIVTPATRSPAVRNATAVLKPDGQLTERQRDWD